MALGYRKDGTKLGFQKGHTISLETRRKIGLANSISLRGRKLSEKTKLNMKIAKKGFIPYWLMGRPLSEEHKNKIRLANSGKNNYFYGKKHSQETKKKISKTMKIARLGVKHSEETKQKIRERRYLRKQKLGYINAPEIRYKFGINNGYGEKSHNWKGGKSFEPYSPLFNKQLKDRIRVRDNFICQLCGVPELELTTRLHAHHIDYDKKNNQLSNLVSLCIKCHMKTNGNRNFWKDYFSIKNEAKNAI